MKKRLLSFVLALAALLSLLCACNEDEAHSHSLIFVEATEATCRSEGNISFYICPCGKYLSDAQGLCEIFDKFSVITPKSDHPVRYKIDKQTHEKIAICGHTDVVFEREGHTLDENNVCTTCGYPNLSLCLERTYRSEDGKASITLNGFGTFSYNTGTITMRGFYKIMGEENDSRIQLLVQTQIVDEKVTTLEDPYYIGDEDGVRFVEGELYIVVDTTKYLLQEFE